MIKKNTDLFYLSVIAFIVIFAATNPLLSSNREDTDPLCEEISSHWRTYTNSEHGYSFDYPSNWQYRQPHSQENNQKCGVSAVAINIYESANAQEYAERYILPVYKDAKIKYLTNPDLDGFIIEDKHLFSSDPGPDAVIVNPPHGIRISLNTTGLKNSDEVFNRIVSSVKIWGPYQ